MALLLKKREDGKSPIDLGDERFYLMWLNNSDISHDVKVEILSKQTTSDQLMLHYLRDKHPTLVTTILLRVNKSMLIISKSSSSRDLDWIDLLTNDRDDLGEECLTNLCRYMQEEHSISKASTTLEKLLDILCEDLGKNTVWRL